ncbi:MAG TPA: S-layer homology domain-containing protein [Firmicutes bacterium]|nr:S-layer homology domain-containing protein [Bacillota bacterium]
MRTKLFFKTIALTMTIFIFPMLPGGIASVLPGGVVSAAFRDTQHSWASDAIEALSSEGIIGGYPDGTFKPEASISRAEFAKIVARSFAIRPSGVPRFKDVRSDNWARGYIAAVDDKGIMSGYPDGTFRPSQGITRAEVATALVRALGLNDKLQPRQPAPPTFADVQNSHWAFRQVEMLNKLGVVPVHFGALFQPGVPATRAEVAWMVKGLTDLKTSSGKLAAFDPMYRTVTVRMAGGREETMSLGPDTEVFRNSVAADLDNLRTGDDVYVVATAYGEPKFITARGIVTKDDLANKVSVVTKGALTPDQVKALAEGRWNSVREGLEPVLRDRLLAYGLTPEEASSLLSQDWSSLGGLAKERLASVISQEIGVSTDLVIAVMDKDWQKAKTYGEIELAGLLLSKVLNM